MMIRKVLLMGCALLIACSTYAQDNDVATLSIRVMQPEREYLSSSSCRLLQTKMTQILTSNGISKDTPSNRFVLTAKANVLNKDIIAGSPTRISEQIELTFIIGDVIDNIKYGTYVLLLTGVGLNEEQALQQAIKNVKTNDTGIDRFIDDSKAKIVEYYCENETKIISNADVLASQGRYEEALYSLSMVPDAYGSLYSICQEKMLEINRQKVNEEGKTLLSQAKAIWAKSPDGNGAEAIYPLITAINPSADCFGEVDSFLKQITTKLLDDDRREWDFKMKQYEDAKAREQRDFDARQQREARDAAIRKQEIDAARQVAVEFARNQPDVIYYNTILLW